MAIGNIRSSTRPIHSPSRAERRGRSLPNTSDAYARVMTFNVYKGQADPQAIVELVRDQRVEVLALQETTEDFVKNSMRLVLSIICRMRRSHRLTAYSVTASGRPRHLPIRPTMT